jgi:hypothetical protein
MQPGPLKGASPALRRLSWTAAVWALLYAGYRAYYALGGSFGMFGIPADVTTWRLINLAAVVPLIGAATLPAVAWPLWRHRGSRRVLLGMAWVIAVGCVMHGLIDEVTHLLSLAGLVELVDPVGFWVTIDHRTANLQDVLFNEPWFIGEGLLWMRIAWIVLASTSARRWWMGSAALGISVLVAAGLLATFGVIGRLVIL